MKRTIIFFLTISVWLTASAHHLQIQVNERQQVALAFPAEIRYADFGSGELEGKTLSHQKVLSIKSRSPHLNETSVSVVTADGQYYEFVVSYADCPSFLAYDMESGPIVADTIRLSVDRTTHFIAASSVLDYAVGSDSIVMAYAQSIENILKAKAMYTSLHTSSICIVTESGLYPFVVDNSSCLRTTVPLGTDTATGAIFQDASVNHSCMDTIAQKVLQERSFLTGIGTLAHKMEFSLQSIMSDEQWVMFRLMLANRSDIDYAVDFVKVYIKDKRTSRRMATQEDEITPVYVYYPDGTSRQWLRGRTQMEFVQFFHRFTLPEKRMLVVEVFEKNGGRHLYFQVQPKELLRAKKLAH